MVGTTTWSTIATNVFSDTWRDTNAVANVYYRYRVNRSFTTSDTSQWPSVRAVLSGAPVDYRGRAILLVDNTLTNALSSTLRTYTSDLIADGWQVIRYGVPRHIDYPFPYSSSSTNSSYYTNSITPSNVFNANWIKTQILQPEYLAHSNDTNVVIIIGHVTMPYSGVNNQVDHHPDHGGAWPCDAWYGDLSTNWADSLTDYQNPYWSTNYSITVNYAGDGRWDQVALPREIGGSIGQLEMAVGRIDFHLLPVYIAGVEEVDNTRDDTELRLLNNYFGKIARFRRGQIAYSDDLIAYTGDGTFYPVIRSAKTIKSSNWGLDDTSPNISSNDVFLQPSAHLWGIHGDYGFYDAIGNGQGAPRSHPASLIAQSPLYAGQTPQAMFMLVFGSYFGEWLNASGNDFMRVCLAQPNTVMAISYISVFENVTWQAKSFSAGGSGGSFLQETYAANVSADVRVTEYLGDATLHQYYLIPPTSVLASVSGGNVVVTWPVDSAATIGYRVYYASGGFSTSWTSIGTTASGVVSFTHVSPGNGLHSYLVKAMAIHEGGSGSYTNLSIGTLSNIISLP